MKIMKHVAAAVLFLVLAIGVNAFAETEQNPQNPMPTAPSTGSAVQPPGIGEILWSVVQAVVL